jgi:anaerobic C4-dicarboxylate transporter DcuA
MFWLQLLILLVLILIGARLKGVGLGFMGALGTLIYVYVFNLPLGKAPIDVMLIILCVISAAASLQAAGGLAYLVSLAEKIIRKNPASITFIAPLVTFTFTLLAGTAHICYSLLPIIAEVAAKKRIRPERPLSIAVVAANFGITASPITAATIAMYSEISLVPGNQLGIVQIVGIVLPASIVGIFAGSIVASFVGVNLDKDPIFLSKMKDPAFKANIDGEPTNQSKQTHTWQAKLSVFLFLSGVFAVILFGINPQWRRTSMVESIQLIMLSVVLLNVAFVKIKATDIASCSIFKTGTEAIVSIFGVVWMSNTFINAHTQFLTDSLQPIVGAYPWLFALAVFIMAALLFSQTATVKAIMPLGLQLGILPVNLIAMFPAVNGDFVIPSYPTLVAAINFDKTGTTKVGKFLINHSFILPGITLTFVSMIVAYFIGNYFYAAP